MKAELYKRLFRAIFSEDIASLKKIAITIIQEERKLGHNVLADSLEKISITEKPKYTLFDSRKKRKWIICFAKEQAYKFTIGIIYSKRTIKTSYDFTKRS